MSTYLIGDIHGCYNSLKNILTTVSFNPKKDTLWITGDLVAKGPNSLKVLNFIYNIKNSVKIVLGNHDLNLLRLYSNFKNKNYKKNTNHTNTLLDAPNIDKLMIWLRHQPMLQIDETKKIIMTHAGIKPEWNIGNVKKYAKEIENILQNNNYTSLLNSIYAKKTNINTTNLQSKDLIRIEHNINVFTKMRYLLPNGQLDMNCKDIPEKAPYPLCPWFNLPGLVHPNYNIIFGHWSALRGKGTPHGIYGLDSGCYQGGKLTLLQWENKKIIRIICKRNFL